MILNDFFDYLAYGSLSQLSVGTYNNGSIAESDYPKIVTFINMALTQLHAKLDLKREQVLLEANSFQPRYVLSSQYARSNTSSDKPKFILDEVMPFTDNILIIDQVHEKEGGELALNDSSDDNTVYTPDFRTLQFAKPQNGLFAVLYRANHPKISTARTLDPTTVEIGVPDFLLQPLACFVASCVIGNGGNAESTQEGLLLMSKFDAMVENIKSQGLIQVDMPTREYIWSNRWV